jgi:hypothetical protein
MTYSLDTHDTTNHASETSNKKNSTDATKTPNVPPTPVTDTGSPPAFTPTKPTSQDLLAWCQESTKDYRAIKINNFASTWRNGMAFCALIDK